MERDILKRVGMQVRLDPNKKKNGSNSAPSWELIGRIEDIPAAERAWRGYWGGDVGGNPYGHGIVITFVDDKHLLSERNGDYTKDTLKVQKKKNGTFVIRSTQFGLFVGNINDWDRRPVDVIFLNQNTIFIPWKEIYPS